MCAEIKSESRSHARGNINWLGWFGVAVLIYFLSSGPVMWMVAKGYFGAGRPLGGATQEVVADLYYPITLAYHDTFLHKPLGLYFHLWAPALVDTHGNL